MTVEVVSYMLSNKDIRMRLGFQLILQMHGLYLPGGRIKKIPRTQGDQKISGVVWIRQERFGLDSSKTLCKGLSIYL